jgi:GDP-4-dehydro-6-deoxy-D-mannose reductase
VRSLLITGANGFVGRHLVARTAQAFDVTAVGRSERPADLPEQVKWARADLVEPATMEAIERDWWGVVHLAAETVPSRYGSNAPLTASLQMLLNLLDRVQSGRVLVASSCLVYSDGNEVKTEESPTRPNGKYGLTKLLVETGALAMVRSVDVRVARPFNHIGRHMLPELAVPSIVRRVQAAENGAPIEMMGLDSLRDFLDVEDIIEAYLKILEIDVPEYRTFNVCSGRTTGIGELARTIVAALGKTNPIVFANKANSTDDRPALVGDPSRLMAATDWRPEISLEEIVARLF